VKRIHEYKRQLLNVFRIIAQYDRIKKMSPAERANVPPPSPPGKQHRRDRDEKNSPPSNNLTLVENVPQLYTAVPLQLCTTIQVVPRTVMIGGKAAAGYFVAKKILSLANAVGRVLDADAETNKYIKLVVIENYKVSNAQVITPALPPPLFLSLYLLLMTAFLSVSSLLLSSLELSDTTIYEP